MNNLVALLLFYSASVPQKEVKIGERVPDFVIRNIINYKKSEIRLSDLKGKLVIFDFGNTGCASCIKLLPEMDRLQKQFGDKIQVFFVIPESKERGQEFLKKNHIARTVSIPVITGDSILLKKFPHTFIPFESWVDKDGKLIARTDPDYVTAANIQSVLDNRKVDFVMQFEQLYDFQKPLLQLDSSIIPPVYNKQMEKKLYYSTVTNHLDGVGPTYKLVVDSTAKTVKFSFINFSIKMMYDDVWHPNLPPTQQIMDVAQPDRIEYKKAYGFRAEWNQKNTYCYESVLPLSLTDEERLARIKSDLTTYFGIKPVREQRELECWVLRKAADFDDKWKNALPVTDELKAHQKEDGLMTINTAMGYLNWNAPGLPPSFNELNLSKEQSTQFFLKNLFTTSDYDTIRKKLSEYGIALVKEKRTVDLYILSDH